VTAGTPFVRVHYNDPGRLDAALELLRGSITIASEAPTPVALIRERL